VVVERKLFRTRLTGPHPFADICDSLVSLFPPVLVQSSYALSTGTKSRSSQRTGKKGEVPKYFALKRPQELAIGKLEEFNSFSQTGFSVLESRLQSDVPEPAFNGRKGLVVVVFKVINDER
jgi:hypothetical protein